MADDTADISANDEQEMAELELKFLAGDLDKPAEADEEGEAEEPAEPKAEAQSLEEPPAKEAEVETPEPTGEGAAIQENKRLRAQKREAREEVETLRAQLQALEQRVAKAVPAETPAATKTDAKTAIKAATMEELLQAEESLDEQLVEAKQAGDAALVDRIRKTKLQVREELYQRPAQAQANEARVSKAQAQWQSLEHQLTKTLPELKDKDSTLMKTVKSFADDNPELMAQLGEHVGGIVATAQAIIQTHQTKGPKPKAANLVNQLEAITQSSVSKGGSSASPQASKSVDVDRLTDEQMDEMANKIKAGEMSLSALG